MEINKKELRKQVEEMARNGGLLAISVLEHWNKYGTITDKQAVMMCDKWKKYGNQPNPDVITVPDSPNLNIKEINEEVEEELGNVDITVIRISPLKALLREISREFGMNIRIDSDGVSWLKNRLSEAIEKIARDACKELKDGQTLLSKTEMSNAYWRNIKK